MSLACSPGVQSSIEDLLAKHSRTIEINEAGVGFGASGGAEGPSGPPSLDLNAEDFWEQVLPGFQSADKLLARLNDPDGPIQGLKKLAARRSTRDPDATESRHATSTAAQRRELKDKRDEFV